VSFAPFAAKKYRPQEAQNAQKMFAKNETQMYLFPLAFAGITLLCLLWLRGDHSDNTWRPQNQFFAIKE
jgi:hypothetical protein